MGQFNVQSCYSSLTPTDPSITHTWIWKLPTPPKIMYFLWLCIHHRLPTNSYLAPLSIINNNLCPHCSTAAETIQYLFFECPTSRPLWDHPVLLHLIDTIKHLTISLIERPKLLIKQYKHHTPYNIPRQP